MTNQEAKDALNELYLATTEAKKKLKFHTRCREVAVSLLGALPQDPDIPEEDPVDPEDHPPYHEPEPTN